MNRENKEPAFLSKEPIWLLDEFAQKGCLTFADDIFTYFVNRHAKIDLLWTFWICYAEFPYGEDTGLENSFYPALTSKENWVRYSETMVIPDDEVWRDANYPLGYRISPLRIDFYVTKSEFKEAFLALRPLGRKRGDGRIREVTIFHGIRVCLLDDSEFGDSSSPEKGIGNDVSYTTG